MLWLPLGNDRVDRNVAVPCEHVVRQDDDKLLPSKVIDEAAATRA